MLRKSYGPIFSEQRTNLPTRNTDHPPVPTGETGSRPGYLTLRTSEPPPRRSDGFAG